MQKYRISTNVGLDQKVVFELKEDYDLLEILSLKFTQTEAYTSMCSDYGVVVGRVSVNNGLGIPNAKVSIFIPLDDVDTNDPVISVLYPYKLTSDKDENGYRYNLLPSRQQHGGHAPTGTFPDQKDILNREEILEVYEKYLKFTSKTNDAGDFMIWGVPVGKQLIHVDVDLSDIGCFSLRPDDFIRQGKGVDNFKNSYTYKASNDLDALPQVISFDRNIEVYPFWGNESLCELGITRTDFDLSSKGVKIEPKAYVLGSIFSDQNKSTVNKNCRPRPTMGRKCDLTSFPAHIEMIRFTTQKDSSHRPILEVFELHEDVDESGSFVIPVPMNMEYVFTNEFGENEITNDPNKGVPTSACYRFRISGKDESLGRVRTVGSYLLPNIKEYQSTLSFFGTSFSVPDGRSYTFSTNWDDYHPTALTGSTGSGGILKNNFGSYYPEDCFYRFTYNKVYGVSSYMGGHHYAGVFGIGGGRSSFVGIKEISPKDESDCDSSIVTPPANYAVRNFTFGMLLAIIINVFERMIYKTNLTFIQILIIPFSLLADIGFTLRFSGRTLLSWYPFKPIFSPLIESIQKGATFHLSLVTYPDCESCDEVQDPTPTSATSGTTNPSSLYQKVGSGVAVRDIYSIYIKCEQLRFDNFGLSGATFSYTDCDTNTVLSTTLMPGSTLTVCSRIGTTPTTTGGTITPTGYCTSTIKETFTPICDPTPLQNELLLSGGMTSYTPDPGPYGQSLATVFGNMLSSPPTQYYMVLTSYLADGLATTTELSALSTLTLSGNTLITLDSYSCGPGGYLHNDATITSAWLQWNTGGASPDDYAWSGITYDIYDASLPVSGSSYGVGLTDTGLPGGCKQYNNVYDTSIVGGTYCATGVTEPYSGLTFTGAPNCSSVTGNPLVMGQVIRQCISDACNGCVTRSGFSEFRFGVYTIIPANHFCNWDSNYTAINEYCRRKLVGKVFCEGAANFSFADNWLTGSLYMVPFKAKVRANSAKYCSNLVLYKRTEFTGTEVNRFYYRSTPYDGSFELIQPNDGTLFTSLGHPTTFVDMGPRDEFINQICVDPNLDPNCSVTRNIGPTSFQNFKEMLGLYINYRLETDLSYNYKKFFQNTFDVPTNDGTAILNGDILQLVSMNNEAGIEGFDLDKREYGAYNPSLLDANSFTEFFKSQSGSSNGPLPIEFALGTEGYRIRDCLNEPGRLTESSQKVPFFLWNKQGQGFGEGVNQQWDYTNIYTNFLQGETYAYNFTGDTAYEYVLFPMTKTYSGNSFSFSGTGLNDIGFDAEDYFIDYHTNYDGEYEGFTYLYVASTGTTTSAPYYEPTAGTLYIRNGDIGGWTSQPWTSDTHYIIKPTTLNYNGNKQILSTPFLFYFGIRPGKTAVDKFKEKFGPLGAFPFSENG